jgi:hypothetical protein
VYNARPGFMFVFIKFNALSGVREKKSLKLPGRIWRGS